MGLVEELPSQAAPCCHCYYQVGGRTIECRSPDRYFYTRHWEVVLPEDGPQAIQVATESRLALIIMDIYLAGMNGIDTYPGIKEILPDCAVAMMTGSSVEALVQQALSQGAMTVLQKPLSIEQLLEISNKVTDTIL